MALKPYHPPPPKCGCCCNVKTGAIAIICIEIIGSLMELSKNIYYVIKYEEFLKKKHSEAFEEYWKKEFLYGTVAWYALFALVGIVGLIGVHKMKPILVIPFMVFQLIGIILSVAVGALFIYVLSQEDKVEVVSIVGAAGLFVGAMVMAFFLWVVWKCYQWMKLCSLVDGRRMGAVHPEIRQNLDHGNSNIHAVPMDHGAANMPGVPDEVGIPEAALPEEVDLENEDFP